MTQGGAVQVEVAVESVAGARRAAAAGATRLELAAGLVLGGLTPSSGLIAAVREAVSLPLFILIRPRPGDFLYEESEIEVMRHDIAAARRLGADGVVVGVLEEDGDVDHEAMRRLIDAARPFAVTFHRAFDLARDRGRALDALVGLGVKRILTSGQAATAEAGIDVIRALVKEAGDRIGVMAGGGVNAGNAARLVQDAGVREVHLSGRTLTSSPMQFRRPGVGLGTGASLPGEYERYETDAERVRAVVAAVSG